MYGTDVGPVSAVIMGALSRTITVVVVQPLTLIKTRYEVTCFIFLHQKHEQLQFFQQNFMLYIVSDLQMINQLKCNLSRLFSGPKLCGPILT